MRYSPTFRWLLGLLLLAQSGWGKDPLLGENLPFLLEVFSRNPSRVEEVQRVIERTSSVSSSIANQSAIAAAVGSAAPGGFVYTIDEFGIPVRTTQSLGATLWGQAPTLGRGKLSVGMNWIYLDYQEFNGESLNDALDLPDFELDTSFSLETTIVSLAVNYGLLEKLDVGVIVPLVSHDWQGSLRLGGIEIERWEGGKSGLGDILLISKYHLYHREPGFDVSIAARLKLPNAEDSPDALLGTGETDFKLGTILGYRWGQLDFSGDLGYNWSGLGNEFDAFEYRLGMAYPVTESWTVFTGLVGSQSDQDIFNTLDWGVGMKWNLWRNLLVEFAARFPLNDDGLRTDWTPSASLEYRF